MSRKLTAPAHARILDQLRAGVKLAEIAREHQVDVSTISRIATTNGLRRSHNRGRYPERCRTVQP